MCPDVNILDYSTAFKTYQQLIRLNKKETKIPDFYPFNGYNKADISRKWSKSKPALEKELERLDKMIDKLDRPTSKNLSTI